jgi:hypothetical protein
MTNSDPASEGKKEACKTYIEQTKLLVALASAFLFAPAGVFVLLKDRGEAKIETLDLAWFIVLELLFVISVVAGYVALGALAGSQHDGKFNVHRPAIRVSSLVQFFSYIAGIAVFAWLCTRIF